MTTAAGAHPDLEGWTHIYAGKVRDLYVPQDASAGAPGDVVLVVASDRISAYDYVLPSTIPDKGKILTALSLWWFEQLADIVPNHVVSLDVPEQVTGRAIICRQLRMYPIECVARGYITGSAMTEYKAASFVCGVALPPGLVESQKLPEPIFTPAAKAAVGEHDENITFEQTAERVGDGVAGRLRELTLAVYARAARIAAERGLLLADTKLEFGASALPGEADIVLGDEVLTPDSSRFWGAADYRPGRAQLRQAVRARLAGLGRGRLGPARRRPATPAAGRRHPAHPGPLRRGVRAAHRHRLRRLTGHGPATGRAAGRGLATRP
ncbi:phosphoribosylaminoimidazolesuccinocarboxamide synthase [Georgenia yuyongxinii]